MPLMSQGANISTIYRDHGRMPANVTVDSPLSKFKYQLVDSTISSEEIVEAFPWRAIIVKPKIRRLRARKRRASRSADNVRNPGFRGISSRQFRWRVGARVGPALPRPARRPLPKRDYGCAQAPGQDRRARAPCTRYESIRDRRSRALTCAPPQYRGAPR